MIACISPYANAYEDTLNTLKYANRAKNIKTVARRNVLNVSHHISNYTEIINRLKNEIESLRSQLSERELPMSSSAKFPNTPLESGQIAINTHFANEAKIRKRILESEQSIKECGFKLY